MIVEDERDLHTQYSVLEFQQVEDEDLTFTVKKITKHSNTIGRRKEVRDPQIHQQLKEDLIENIWDKFGHLPNNI